MAHSSKPTYYSILGLHPSASVIDIRRAYRELSKRYHPDTTVLPATIAISKFQQINEAYATLSNAERRLSYDLKIGYSQFGIIQAPPNLNRPVFHPYEWSKSADLKPSASESPTVIGGDIRPIYSGVDFCGLSVISSCDRFNSW